MIITKSHVLLSKKYKYSALKRGAGDKLGGFGVNNYKLSK